MIESQRLRLDCLQEESGTFKGYQRELILQEKQAYEGAKMFYFGVLPLSIVALIFFTAFLYEESTDTVRSKILSISVYIFLTVLSYIIAVYYYIKCNKIQSYPAPILLKPNHTELKYNQAKIHMISQQNTFNNDNENIELRASFNSSPNKPSRHFCSICQHICEYRTKHCRKCQTCIQRYDHHCFWIGNCVGRHNHRQFYLFLLVQSFNNWIQMKAILQVKAYTYESEIKLDWIIWLIIYAMILTSFGFLCFTGYLGIYHTMLIVLGTTTWEQMRRDYIGYLKYLPKGLNPFSIGWKSNIKKFFTQFTRASSENVTLDIWQGYLPTYQEAKLIKPGFNFIDNEVDLDSYGIIHSALQKIILKTINGNPHKNYIQNLTALLTAIQKLSQRINNIQPSLLIDKHPMKALAQKVSFKLKKNKTDTEKAILLNEQYSANIRQLYNLLHSQSQLPKHKLLPILFQQLSSLKNNMKSQLQLYKPYINHQLLTFLTKLNLINSDSLISIYEEKQNQIQNINEKLNSKKRVHEKKGQLSNKLETIQLLQKHLQEQKGRRVACFSKIQKIKEQLQMQTKNLIENKISNFDQQIEFRKLQKTYQFPK